MTIESNNNLRTHEPSLRELTAELDGLRSTLDAKIEGVEKVANERDRFYLAGLAAQDKATVKAELAQQAYNIVHNDLLKKMEGNITRGEYAAFVKQMEDKWTEAKDERELRIEALRKDCERDTTRVLAEIAAVRDTQNRTGWHRPVPGTIRSTDCRPIGRPR